jgi:hypothetical protein
MGVILERAAADPDFIVGCLCCNAETKEQDAKYSTGKKTESTDNHLIFLSAFSWSVMKRLTRRDSVGWYQKECAIAWIRVEGPELSSSAGLL